MSRKKRRKARKELRAKAEQCAYTPRTEDEMNQLAVNIMESRIFTSDMLGPDTEQMLSMVFVPVMFIDRKSKDRMLEHDITLFYENYAVALPRGVNGYPMFMSMKMLNRADHARLNKKLVKMYKLREQLLSGEIDEPKE